MRILICLRNHILAEGVKGIIKGNLDGATLADYYSGSAFDDPDLVLFDSREAIDELMQGYPGARFICFDLGLKNSELACLLYCHGISGVISTDLDIVMFCKALRTVHKGDIWLEQAHLKILLREGRAQPHREGIKSFSRQDKQIVRLVTSGMKNKDIADCLFLSLPTVKAHLSRIYKTLNIENRAQLVALAAESGWLPDENHPSPSAQIQ
jgi:DNA-binding NarL/FixJ family response regulator